MIEEHAMRHRGHDSKMYHLPEDPTRHSSYGMVHTRLHHNSTTWWSQTTTVTATDAHAPDLRPLSGVAHSHPVEEHHHHAASHAKWNSDVHYIVIFLSLYILFLVILGLVHVRKRKSRRTLTIECYEDYIARRRGVMQEEEALIPSAKSESNVNQPGTFNGAYHPDPDIPGNVV